MYPILVQSTMRLLRADHGTLALLDPTQRTLRCVYVTGRSARLVGTAIPVAESGIGHILQADAGCVIGDLSSAVTPIWLERDQEIGPAIVAPVSSEAERIGILALSRSRGPGSHAFTEGDLHILQGIAAMGGTAIRRARLHDALQRAYAQVVVSLAHAIEARDAPTATHSQRLVSLADAVARQLGCDDTHVEHIRWGACLHDIGKIGVSDDILRKPAALTHHEWVLMRQHPIIGEEILGAVPWMRGVAKLVRHHQERWDGTGYPDGLRGEEIPLGARILAVVDAYSAMIEERPYRTAMRQPEAIAELRRCAGTQFDPQVVDAVCETVDSTLPHTEGAPARLRARNEGPQMLQFVFRSTGKALSCRLSGRYS